MTEQKRKVSATPLIGIRTRGVDWIYADRIPLRTTTIIAGQGGIAKSTIIADIIARATRGELEGSYLGRPISVGIISPEDDMHSILVPRLMAAGADLGRVADVSVVLSESEDGYTSTLPNLADDLESLGEMIDDTGIKLLVVDPLVSIMSGNSISQSDVRRNLDPLSALAIQREIGVLAVAHFGKSGERAGDRLSGSHAFRDVTRSLMVCAIDSETDLRVLTVEKSNYSPIHPSDAYRVDSEEIELHDGRTQAIGRAWLVGPSEVSVQQLMERERDTSNLSGTSQKLIESVNSHPESVDVATAAKETGIHPDVARKYLGRAADRGDIVRVRRGVFAPVSRGVSVPSGSNSPQTTHIGHISYRDTCPVCGEQLHAALLEAGISQHPNCSEVAE